MLLLCCLWLTVLDREGVHLTCTCLRVLLGRKGVSLSCTTLGLFGFQGRKGVYLLPVMIRNVSPQAQQELAMAICECSPTNDRVILCHTPALLEPIDQCTLGTFDQFDECFEANMNVSLILPRPGLIHSIVKKHTGKVLTFHAVFHVNSHSGPIEVCVDLLQKAKQ